MSTSGITRLNHAVLYVRDADTHARFYTDVLGFEVVVGDDDGRFAFMRAPASANHHDIAFFTIGAAAESSSAGRETVGMYHLAWEVPTMEALAEVHGRLRRAGALVGASDHGTSKSLYAADPDGLEFEVMFLVPADEWGSAAHDAVVRPLDLPAELDRWGGIDNSDRSGRQDRPTP